VACRLEENFPNAKTFMPERWLKTTADRLDKSKRINPYLVLPFGHGIRSCIARRFAEQNMLLLLIRVKNLKYFCFPLTLLYKFYKN